MENKYSYYRWDFKGMNPEEEDLDKSINLGEYKFENDLFYEEFEEGKPINNWSKKNHAIYENNGPWHDVIPNFGQLPIISKKLYEFLEKNVSGEIQSLPLPLKRIDGGQIMNGYFIINILNLINCIDLKRTEWKKDPEYPDGINITDYAPVLNQSMIGNFKIFRPQYFSLIVVIREDLKQKLEEESFTGCYFYKLRTNEEEGKEKYHKEKQKKEKSLKKGKR